MHTEKNVIFIGSPLPEELVELRTMSFNSADNIAQNVMVRGLHQHYGERLTVISEISKPSPTELDLGEGVTASVISSNGSNRALYYLSLLTGYTKKLKEVLQRPGMGPDTIVITRGSYVFIALPVLFARMRHRLKWVPFTITTVEVPEYGFPFSIVSKLSRWTSKKAFASIGYVAKTAEDYMPGKPSLEIMYSIGEEKVKLYTEHPTVRAGKFSIAYTGALSKTYNFDYVLEAIRMSGSRYKWIFAGSGPYAEQIRELSESEDFDVDYLGNLSNADAIRVQRSSHVLICPRGGNPDPAAQYYSKYAASGKLVEYLCSGTPILASDVPSTSREILPFLTLEESPTASQFLMDIAGIEQGYTEKLRIAEEGKKVALEQFNAEHQNARVYDFLEGL